MTILKKILLWILAFVITVGAAYYQRITGPTYPAKAHITINGTTTVQELKRTQTNTQPCNIEIQAPDNVTGQLFFRRYPGTEEWTVTTMQRTGNILSGLLPSQPAAGKLEYYISLTDGHGGEFTVCKENPVVIRFKGDVPAGVLIPHILLMFAAMLLSTLAGLFAVSGYSSQRIYGQLTLLILLAGGFILGPLVQNYAFGELWTGIPFGWDLTDNKTLIATAVWLAAVLLNRKKESRRWTIIAAIVLLIVYSIPHSLFGSQLDYTTNSVTQGFMVKLISF